MDVQFQSGLCYVAVLSLGLRVVKSSPMGLARSLNTPKYICPSHFHPGDFSSASPHKLQVTVVVSFKGKTLKVL